MKSIAGHIDLRERRTDGAYYRCPSIAAQGILQNPVDTFFSDVILETGFFVLDIF